MVRWADAVNVEQGRETEFEEILGYHLEQAYECWTAIGLLDAHARAIGADGARRLGAAGRRALERGDVRAAANLLGRAAALLDSGDPQRPAHLLLAGDARLEAGSFEDAAVAYAEAGRAAVAAGQPALVVAADLEAVRLRYLTTGDVEAATVVERVEAGLPVLEAGGERTTGSPGRGAS